MALLYFVITALYFFPEFQIYENIYLYGSEICGASLFFCYREYYEAELRRKCMWQKASIIGVASYCIINIMFVGNYDLEYYDRAQFYSFFIVNCVICFFILVEEIEVDFQRVVLGFFGYVLIFYVYLLRKLGKTRTLKRKKNDYI